MLRYALPRFYFAIIGLMLLTLPLFAAARGSYARTFPVCSYPPRAVALHLRCSDVIDGTFPPFLREGPFYALWQRGTPPDDYWPLALVLLAAGAATETVVILRARRRLA